MSGSPVQCSYGIPAAVFESATLVYRFPEPGRVLPLEPVLSWVRQTWLNLDEPARARISASIEWYLPQKNFFDRWLACGEVHRDDEIPFYPAEFDYERTALTATLARLTAALCAAVPQRWIWLDFRNACPSILLFCEILMDTTDSSRIRITAETDGRRSWPLNRGDDPWYPFMERLEAARLILPDERALHDTPAPDPAVQPVTVPEPDPGAVLSRCLAWYAWRDGLSAWPALADADPLEWALLLEKTGRFDEAVLFLNRVWEQRGRETITRTALAGMALVRIQCEKKDFAGAAHVMEVLEDIMKNGACNGLRMTWETHMVYFWSGNGWNSNSLEHWEVICEHARQLGWRNTLGFLLALVPLYYQLIAHRGFEAAVATALSALAEAEELGNRYRVSVLLHVLGFLHERHGDPVEALHWFDRCIAVRQELKDPVELIKVYNGTGYFSFSIGEFSKALNLYQKSLELLKDRHDFTETCLTLFNIALINIFSGRHETALQCLDAILEVVDLLEYASLPWHRRSKILALAAYAASHLGRRTLADHYAGSILEDDIDTESLPYVALARARVYRDCGWLDRAQTGNENWPVYLKKQYEAERILLGGTDSAALAQVAQQTRSQGLVMQADWLECLAGGIRPAVPAMPESFYSLLAALKLAARQEATARKLMVTIGEITFVRQFQSSLASLDSRKKVLGASRILWKTQFSPHRVSISRRKPANQVPQQLSRCLPSPGGDIYIVLTARPGRHFTADEERLFSLTADHLSVVWELIGTRERLDKASTLDALTGAINRAELFRQLELERKRASRGEHKRPFSILFIDLDNFKHYNDTLGHRAGDLILKCFCDMTRSLLRDTDSLGRYGGDEFVVLLPDTDAAGARLTGERILAALKAENGFVAALKSSGFDPDSAGLTGYIGASIGMAVWTPDLAGVEDLVHLADERVYRAKSRGKNRVEG